MSALFAAQQAAAHIQQAKPVRPTGLQIVKEAMERAGQPNGVTVQEVPKTNKFISQGGRVRNALAARDPEGGEWILINQDARGADLVPQTQHEVAHILAWRKHGEKIREHGPEWARICREVVQERQNEYCRIQR